MKITGSLVDMLLKLDPDNFKLNVVHKKEQTVIYAVVIREIYGMLVCIVTMVPGVQERSEFDWICVQ